MKPDIHKKRFFTTKRDRFKKESLPRSVVISSTLHFVALVIIMIIPAGFLVESQPPVDLMWVELPKGTGEDIYGLKDVNRLPESTIQQQQQEVAAPPEEPKENPKLMPEPKSEEKEKPKEKIADKKVEEKKVKPQSNMNKALAKIDKRLETRADPEAAQTGSSGEGYKDGTSDKPLRVSRDDAELLKYRATVRAKIMSQWVIPGDLKMITPERRPVVRVLVHINKSGNVISKSYANRSPLESLNSSAMRAIDRASPFPIPPERIKWEAYNEGFMVEFNARNR